MGDEQVGMRKKQSEGNCAGIQSRHGGFSCDSDTFCQLPPWVHILVKWDRAKWLEQYNFGEG